MKTIRILLFTIIGLFMMTSMTSCHYASIDPEWEGVYYSKPFFWGHEGVHEDAFFPGRSLLWSTTHVKEFHIVPIEYQEGYTNIFTADNNPVIFNSYAIIQIDRGMTPILYDNWGENWYNSNVKEKFRKLTRDKVCLFELFQMTTDRHIADSLERVITKELQAYIDELKGADGKTIGMPVTVNLVTIGRISPTDEILDEINRTGVAKQKQRTLVDENLAEIERKNREESRAAADKAYMNKMGYTQAQIIRLAEIEMMREKSNSTFVFGMGAVPTVPLK